jgi:hypothetical protein
LVRFVFAGLFVNALAVACVVSDGDDDDDTTACDPGTSKDCTCPNGDASERKCSASGNGYGACACTGENVGGAGGGGGEPSTTAGTTSNYGGEAGAAAGGAGGENVGGMTSEGGAGGAGGSAPMCESDPEPCQDCIQTQCCAEWTACSADPGDCEQQFFNILIGCAQVERDERDIINADLELCALEVANGDVWSEGLLPTTKAMIDCIGGGEGWENRDMWNTQSCKAGCFAQEVP